MKVGDTIPNGPYKGFYITGVSRGWYKGYFPSNVGSSCSIEEATCSIRWLWAVGLPEGYPPLP